MRLIIASLVSVLSFYASASSTLTGNINGSEWSFQTGIARTSDTTKDHFDLSLWNLREENPCRFTDGSLRQITATIPAKVGKYALKDGYNITFMLDNSHDIKAKKGNVVITKIADNMIYGSLDVSIDKHNDVKGDFVLPFCDGNFPSCTKFDGRWQNSDVVYYLEHSQKDCSSVQFFRKDLLPPFGEDITVNFIADGQVHENKLSGGQYIAKLDMDGLTIQTNSLLYRYVLSTRCGNMQGERRMLIKQTLELTTGEVQSCYIVGFRM